MRKVFLVFSIILFFSMGVAFVFSAATTKDFVLLIPGGIGFIGAIISIILLCKKQLEYCVIDEELVVKQDGNTICHLKKEDIHSSKFVYDAFDANLYMIQFSTHDKQYNIIINPENREDMLLFFENTTKTISHNLIYYLVVFLIDLQ